MTIRTYQYQVQALVTAPSGSDFLRSATSALSLLQDAYVGEQRSAETILALVGQAVWVNLPFDGVLAESQLNLQQTVSAHGFVTVETALNLSSVAEAQFPIIENISQPLNLGSVASFRVNPINKTVESDLNLQQTLTRDMPISVTTALGLTSVAFRSYTPESDLNLVQVAEWGYGFDAESVISLTGTVDVDKILNQSVTSPNVVSQAVTYFVESPCGKKQFQAFHGEGGIPPKDNPLNYTNTFHIVSLDDGEILTLRNPETDDVRRYSSNRVNREFMDGTRDVFVDPSWVTEQTQLYTIVALKRTELDLLLPFLLNNLGREVLIKDWAGVSWIVIITNPGEVYTEDSEGYWTVDFEVVGEQVDGEYIVEHLDIQTALSKAGSIYTRSGDGTMVLVSKANLQYFLDATSDVTLTGDASFTIESP